MYERFTDRSRKVMQLANQEAQRFNHEYIGTEHILLGLAKEGTGVAANVLKNLDVDLRKVRLEVEKLIQSGPDLITMGKLPQTPRAKKVIELAMEESRNLNHSHVGTEHVLLGLLREQEGVAAQVLVNLGLNLDEVREETLNLVGRGTGADESVLGGRAVVEGQWTETAKSKTPTLDKYGRDLTAEAAQGRLDPTIGSERENERVIQVLCRTHSNNPLLIGDRGFGAANIAHAVAHRIASGCVPLSILHYRVVRWDLEVMVAVTDRGQLDTRIAAVLAEVQKAKNVLLFIENIGPYLTVSDLPRLLRLALASGEVRYIGATTSEIFHNQILPDVALMRCVQAVKLAPPSEAEARELLSCLRSSFEEHYRRTITDAALDAAVRLSGLFQPGQIGSSIPERALNLIDEAGAFVCSQVSSGYITDVRAIAEKIEELDREKEQCVAKLEFERAAALRDQADKLRRKRFEITQQQQDKQSESEAVIDEGIVISVVSQMTGIPEQAIREQDATAVPLPPAVPREDVPQFERLQCRSLLQGQGIQIQQNTGFVLLPLRQDSRELFQTVICPVMEEAGLAAQSTSDIVQQSPSIGEAWELIRSAEVIVVDVSGQDPGVMVQLGLCLAAYRFPILLARSAADLPLNLPALGHLIYEDSVDGRTRLKDELRASIRSFLASARELSTPP